MTRLFDSISAGSLTRLLVVSYFMAVSLGLIDGTELLGFMTSVLPDDLAVPLMRGVVLTLAVLILTGLARRAAALVLSLVVFFSSYIALYGGSDISVFWRDLALVGALLMTANFGTPRERDDDWNRLDATAKPQPPSEDERQTGATTQDAQPFRDDFDIVRTG